MPAYVTTKLAKIRKSSVMVPDPDTYASVSVARLGAQATGTPYGVVTERDVLSLLAREGAASLERRVEEIMTSPVATIRSDAFLYRAVAKMRALGVRRLLAVDAAGRAEGLLQQKDLLGDPGTEAVAIGENLASASTPRGVGEVRRRLPGLAATPELGS